MQSDMEHPPKQGVVPQQMAPTGAASGHASAPASLGASPLAESVVCASTAPSVHASLASGASTLASPDESSPTKRTSGTLQPTDDVATIQHITHERTHTSTRSVGRTPRREAFRVPRSSRAA
jgi:hypothetical protein